MCRTLKVFLRYDDNGGDVDSNTQLTHEQNMTKKLNESTASKSCLDESS